MRVFLSYGHDRNAPLVERIRRDLDMAGHEIWIDTSEIQVGEDWRHRIVDGLKRSDWVLAFLSKHSTRDPGVCLDETAIALHEKAGAISTVLVEPSKDVGAPVTLRHVQHLGGALRERWCCQRRPHRARLRRWSRVQRRSSPGPLGRRLSRPFATVRATTASRAAGFHRRYSPSSLAGLSWTSRARRT